jgi:hypothetical protein
MAIEAAVSIGSGVLAGNLSLVAFGADSVIELASAVVLLWRLRIELQQGAGFPETVEEWARKIAWGLLFALAAYVIASAGYGLGDMKVRNFQHQG